MSEHKFTRQELEAALEFAEGFYGIGKTPDQMRQLVIQYLPQVDRDRIRMRKRLSASIEDGEFPPRAMRVFRAARLKTFYDVVRRDRRELLKFRHLGEKTVDEIESYLHEVGLRLGMHETVDEYFQ